MDLSRFLACAALVAIPATVFAQPADPDTLAEQVVIRRDTYGVPHILAENEEAAFFAYGYAAAEDHMLTIARLYLGARGELSRYFGEEHAESDLMVRRLRIYRVAEERFNDLSPFFRRAVEAYAMGINRYIEQNRETLPDWVSPVSAVDVVAHCRNVVIKEFCMNLDQIKALHQSPEQTAFASGFHDHGSNVWALNGKRSDSGNAMLLGNPHLAWSGSHTWHEVKMTVPDEINFMGATLIGFPGAGLGFNEHLGWSHTVNPHDCDDIYEIELATGDVAGYYYEGRVLPLEKESIWVLVNTEDGQSTRQEDVLWTHYGPIVAQDGTKAYAYKSPHFENIHFLEQWYLMSKATSFDEFRSLLDMNQLPMFNIGYADAEGNCYYLCNGVFPARPAGYDWSGVVPGGTRDTEWLHTLPVDRLPQALNPKGGYIANSNSSPWYTNLNEIMDRNEYSPELFPLVNTLRSQMGLAMLESDRKISFEEMLNYKYNNTLLLADRVKRDLINVIEDAVVEGLSLSDAAAVLSGWDNTVNPDSVGSVLFVTFWNIYSKATNTPFGTPWDESRPNATPYGIGDDAAAVQSMAMAVRQLEADAGTISVPWGAVFRIRMGDVDIPVGGLTTEFGAFRVVGYQPADDGAMVAIGGDSYVFAVEFSDPIVSKSVMAYSQSENPESPHFADQAEIFANHDWKPTFFYESELDGNIVRSYHP